jgi:hypothetical protein
MLKKCFHTRLQIIYIFQIRTKKKRRAEFSISFQKFFSIVIPYRVLCWSYYVTLIKTIQEASSLKSKYALLKELKTSQHWRLNNFVFYQVWTEVVKKIS